MGLPLILGIVVYIIIISALAIWLKNYHTRARANHPSFLDHSSSNEPENADPDKLIKGTSQKKRISDDNSQTTLKSGDKSHK